MYTCTTYTSFYLYISYLQDGNYVFTNKHTKKCLTETAVDKIVQYDCEDDDQKQKWKIIENPCGKRKCTGLQLYI